MASMSMTRFSLSIGVVMVAVAGGTWLLLQRSPEAGPRPPSAPVAKEGAVQDQLPFVNVVTPEQLKRDFQELRVTAYGDPKLYFEITLPLSWENRPVSASREELKNDDQTPLPTGEFAPKGKEDVVVETRYIRVPERVTLDRFLLVYAEKSGFQIVKRQRGDFDGRKVEEALLRMNSPKFGAMLTRITVSRRGEYIFLVAGSCKEADYGKWRQPFAVAALSFNPAPRRE